MFVKLASNESFNLIGELFIQFASNLMDLSERERERERAPPIKFVL